MELSTVLQNVKPNQRGGWYMVACLNASSIIFTDQPAPDGVEVHDVSEAQDGGVVAWKKSYFCYCISTQRSGVKVVAPADSGRLFAGLMHMKTFDGSMLDVSHVKSMDAMFESCGALESVNGLECWDTSNVTSMNGMFSACQRLTDIGDLASWNVSRVADTSEMFRLCDSLTNVNGLETWNVDKVKNMEEMFYLCTQLVNVDGVQAWNISHDANTLNMFKLCDNLTTTPSWYHDDVD
jgi:surface protein